MADTMKLQNVIYADVACTPSRVRAYSPIIKDSSTPPGVSCLDGEYVVHRTTTVFGDKSLLCPRTEKCQMREKHRFLAQLSRSQTASMQSHLPLHENPPPRTSQAARPGHISFQELLRSQLILLLCAWPEERDHTATH